jgi:hypothetical protein
MEYVITFGVVAMMGLYVLIIGRGCRYRRRLSKHETYVQVRPVDPWIIFGCVQLVLALQAKR